MKKACLVCGKEKHSSSVKCKMCGMGIRGEHVVSSGFVFCCMKCSRVFDTLLETLNEKTREEIMKREIII